MKTVIIAAIGRNRVIGRDNGIPWHYPADLRHFRKITLGHPVVMGRRTFESLSCRPLPGRLNIVVTRNPRYAAPPGVIVCPNLEAARLRCEQEGAETMFVIGGAELYAQALPLADEMALTLVPDEVEGDAFFPEWNPEEWEVIDFREEGGLSFVTYRRIIP